VFTVLSFHVPAKITGDDPVTIHLQAAVDNANEEEELPQVHGVRAMHAGAPQTERSGPCAASAAAQQRARNTATAFVRWALFVIILKFQQ
jgi:alkylhydroperoxidase/carboxymuconolactone decarboxylase family protein YurZ